MLAVIHGISVFLAVIGCIVLAGWVLERRPWRAFAFRKSGKGHRHAGFKEMCLGMGAVTQPPGVPRPYSSPQRDAYDVRLQRKAAAGNGQDEAPQPGDSRPRQRLCPEPQLARDAAARESGSGGLVMAQPAALETYNRTLRTMSEVSQTVRNQRDAGGALGLLAARIEVERRWVQAMLAAGREPRRPPAWFCGAR